MSVILVLIPLSIVFAAAFLAAFIWAVRSGQYEDTCTPSMRLLLDDPVRGEGPPSPGEAAGARPSPGAATPEAPMAGTGFTAQLDSRDPAPLGRARSGPEAPVMRTRADPNLFQSTSNEP